MSDLKNFNGWAALVAMVIFFIWIAWLEGSEDPNNDVTLWGNVAISLIGMFGVFYFFYKAYRLPHYWTPLTAMGLVCMGITMRIAPWAYGQLNSDICTAADSRVVCLYDLLIIEWRPWFTAISAFLIIWGFYRFARWSTGKTYLWKVTCIFVTIAVAWFVPLIW